MKATAAATPNVARHPQYVVTMPAACEPIAEPATPAVVIHANPCERCETLDVREMSEYSTATTGANDRAPIASATDMLR